MGIQINGQTDSISAIDGSLTFSTSSVQQVANINATGIITAASANFTGNVSVGGTLTYQDVTNIDSVGIVTARAGVKVPDNQKVFLGTDSDLEIYHDGSNARIRNTTGQLWLQSDNGIRFVDSDVNESTARFTDNGAVELYYDGTKKFETTTTGATITNDLILNHASGDKAIRWATGGTNKWSLYHNNSAGALVAYDNANNAERLRITSDGDLLIGTASNGGGNRLYVVDNFTDGFINPSDSVLRVENANTSGTTTQASISLTSKTSGAAADSAIVSQAEDASGNASLQFWTDTSNGMTEKLRIHSNGSVTKPNNPAFLAGRTGGNQTFTLGTFPFNVARINVGNCWNTSTYKFTAPVAGIYYFFASVYYNDGAGQHRIQFRKTPNGGTAFQVCTVSHQAASNDDSKSMSVMESMAVGDTMELYSDQNAAVQCYYNINNTTYGAHTYMMGYLIG